MTLMLFEELAWAAEDIKDIKPPVDFPTNYFWLFAILFLILLATVIFLIRKFLNKKPAAVTPVIVKSPWELAVERLVKLSQSNLPAKGLFNEYYFQLSLILRHYLEDRFHLKAPEMTTEEFLIHLNFSVDLNNSQKNILKEFMELSDRVKFAKFTPTVADAGQGFDIVKRLVDETKVTSNPLNPEPRTQNPEQ